VLPIALYLKRLSIAEKDRYWDELEGTWRAANQMMWYLKKVR
jgi:hypothetical protein